jgi:maltooligosyltrehalose synthase
MTTKAKDLQDYKTAFPKSRQKKNGYTKKFQKWMRQRVKAGKSDDLWTEPTTVYNEETKRFISTKSKKFFDGRTKKTIKLKKTLPSPTFYKVADLLRTKKALPISK